MAKKLEKRNDKMTLEEYIDNINKRYKLGNATEHNFRGDLQTLIESLVPTIRPRHCQTIIVALTETDRL